MANEGGVPVGGLQDPIYFSSATAIAKAIKNKVLSSEEITRIFLDRIEQVNPKINSVVQLKVDEALDSARKADQVLAKGGDLGPLHGVPMTIKDSFDTGGSIRFPAHCCGLCGIRPTSGRVARTGHIISFKGYDQSLTTVGPLARYVEDLNTVLPVISGSDGIDPYVYDIGLGNPDNIQISSLKIAFYTDNKIAKPIPEVIEVIRDVVHKVANSG